MMDLFVVIDIHGLNGKLQFKEKTLTRRSHLIQLTIYIQIERDVLKKEMNGFNSFEKKIYIFNISKKYFIVKKFFFKKKK